MAHVAAGDVVELVVVIADTSQRSYAFAIDMEGAQDEALKAAYTPVGGVEAVIDARLYRLSAIGGSGPKDQITFLTQAELSAAGIGLAPWTPAVGGRLRVYRDTAVARAATFAGAAVVRPPALETALRRVQQIQQELADRVETHAIEKVGVERVKDYALAGGRPIETGDLSTDVLSNTVKDVAYVRSGQNLVVTDGLDNDRNIPLPDWQSEADVRNIVDEKIPLVQRVPAAAAGDAGEPLVGVAGDTPRFAPVGADKVSVDASGFDGNLGPNDDTAQKVAQKLDDLVIESDGHGVQPETAGAGLLENTGVLSVNPGAGVEVANDKVKVKLDERQGAQFTLDEANGLAVGQGGIKAREIANQTITGAKLANGAVDTDELAAGAVTRPKVDPLLLDAIEHASVRGRRFNDVSLTLSRSVVTQEVFSPHAALTPAVDLDLDALRRPRRVPRVSIVMLVTRTRSSTDAQPGVRGRQGEPVRQRPGPAGSGERDALPQRPRRTGSVEQRRGRQGPWVGGICRVPLFSLSTLLGDVLVRLVRDSNNTVGVQAEFEPTGDGSPEMDVDIDLRASWFASEQSTRGSTTAASARSGFVTSVAPAAQVSIEGGRDSDTPAVATNAWGLWATLMTLPAITAAQAGLVLLEAHVHAMTSSAGVDGGDRTIHEAELMRIRGSVATPLVTHTEYGPRNLNLSGDFNEASRIGDETMVFVEEAQQGDVYSVRARMSQQKTGAGNVRTIDFAVAENYLKVAGMGGAGAPAAGRAEEILLDYDPPSPLDIVGSTELAAAQAFSRELTEEDDGRNLYISLTVGTSSTGDDDEPGTFELAIRAGDWRTRPNQANITSNDSKWVVYAPRAQAGGVAASPIRIDKGANGRMGFATYANPVRYLERVRVRFAAS